MTLSGDRDVDALECSEQTEQFMASVSKFLVTVERTAQQTQCSVPEGIGDSLSLDCSSITP